MSSATEVEEVFTIESGSGLIDVKIVSLKQDLTTGEFVVKIKKELQDTSFFIFTEVSSDDKDAKRRLALMKIGPDVYYGLDKTKTILYRISGNVYLLYPTDTTPDDQFIVIHLKTDAVYLRKQFDEILNFFSTLVVPVLGELVEVDAVRRTLGILDQDRSRDECLYPQLPLDELQSPSAPPSAASDSTYPPYATPKFRGTSTQPEYEAGSASRPAQMVATGLVTGAEYIAMGFNYGTGFAEGLVHKGGAHLVQREKRRERKKIDPKVISTLRAVRYGAETASSVTGAAVDTIAYGARKLSEHLVPHIHRHGTRLVSNVTGKDHMSSSQTMNDILTVTASGFQGFGTIYSGLTKNATLLAKAVSAEAVNYVSKRYGNEAGEATDHALHAAGSTAAAVTACKDLAPKAMVKKVAKETVKEGIKSAVGPSASNDPNGPEVNGASGPSKGLHPEP